MDSRNSTQLSFLFIATAEKQLTLGLGLEMASLVYRLRSRMQLIICGTISQGNEISMWKSKLAVGNWQ